MAIGTYEVKMPAGYGDGHSFTRNYGQVHQRITFTQRVSIRSVQYYFGGTGGQYIFQVFRVSDGALIFEETIPLPTDNITGWKTAELANPAPLTEGEQYSIGYFCPSLENVFTDTSGTGSNLIGVSTPTGVDSTWYGNHYYTNTAGSRTTMPTTTLSDTMMMRLGVDLNEPASASPVSPVHEARNPSNIIRFSWTYSDPDLDPQTAYEIQYRVKDSGGAWTTASGTSSNAYHDFTAGTFTNGQEYEWQVRVNDGMSGFSAWSSYAYFIAGSDTWKYSREVSSTAQTGTTHDGWLPSTYSDFSASDSVSHSTYGWNNSDFFGAYTGATFARSATAGKGGTPGMEVTWPATTAGNKTRVHLRQQNGFVVGAWYEVEAEIYCPSGSPDVTVDPFFQDLGWKGGVTEKDQWVKVVSLFRANSAGVTIAIKNTSPSTAGTKMYVDNFQIRPLSLEPGTYEIQVRASKATGDYSAWSSSATFTVENNPAATGIDLNPKRIGGNVNVTWTYTDNESNPQTKYQVRYK